MKRAVIPEPDDGRRLKRANSSLFSIATLADADDENPAEAMAGMVGGGLSLSPSNSNSNILLVDDDDDEGDAAGEDAPTSYSTLKGSAPGLVLPLDCSDDDAAAPDDVLSSSCSSSASAIDDQEDVFEGACKFDPEGEESADEDPVEEARGPSAPRDLPAHREKSLPQVCRTIDQASPTASSPCEPPIREKAECKEGARVTRSDDHRTGLVFEAGSRHFDRRNRFHKERPLRIASVRDYLAKAKPTEGGRSVFERCQHVRSHGGNCVEVEPKKSPEDLWLDDHDYLRVHLPGYMQRLDRISKCNCHNRLDIEAEQFKSIYFTNDSVREAKAAASTLCNLTSRVVSGDLDNGFAVIRPPGHHAEPGLAGGYCVINNVAVAAAYAVEKLGVKKVLIVDWDVHHGNGTQRCFLDNPDVLYFSAHRYHGGNFFPFMQGGGPAVVGTGAGQGRNVNVGWNEKRMGDDEYLVLWERLLMPVAEEFGPDLVLISAGFDAALGDMGECDVSPECFARLTRRLKTLADGKVVAALEGGYVRSVLAKCVEAVLASLLDANSNDKCKKELQNFYKNVGDNEMLDCINASAAKSIKDTMNAHSKYWDCLKTI